MNELKRKALNHDAKRLTMRLLWNFATLCSWYALLLIPLLAEAKPWDYTHEPIQPLPKSIPFDAKKSQLGRQLFFDTRLSGDQTVSCAHCHDLQRGGVDRLVHSEGVQGRKGTVNAPTVFNAALNIAQFWDGRAKTLEDQINGPIHNPVEMDSNWPQILARLKLDATYQKMFQQCYDDGITAHNVRHAIAEFERTLLTSDSRFDRYLLGDHSAINAREQQGYALFKSYGCIACHQGRNVGGNMFQRFGILALPPSLKRSPLNPSDLGRFNVTGLPQDAYTFKVPSLRMAVCTPPYLHDGSEATLKSTIKLMAKSQLGRTIPDEDVALIIDFLYTLPGRYQERSLAPEKTIGGMPPQCGSQ